MIGGISKSGTADGNNLAPFTLPSAVLLYVSVLIDNADRKTKLLMNLFFVYLLVGETW